MASTRLGYIAIKKEASTTSSDVAAVKPSHFLRFKEGDMMLRKEVIMNDPIQNNRWKSLNAVAGKIASDGSYKLDLDANECVYWFFGGLGALTSSTDVSSATDASVFLHQIDLANTLPMFSIEQGKGNLTDTTNHRQNYQVSRAFGVMVDTWKLSASDGLISLDVGLKAHGIFEKANLLNNEAASGSTVTMELDTVEGLVATSDTVTVYDSTPQSESRALATVVPATKVVTVAALTNSYTVANKAKVELQPQTPSYSIQAKVFSFVHVQFQFGTNLTTAASATAENVENWEIEYSNGIEERYGSKRASPSVIAPKGAAAKLRFTKYFENVTDRDRYLDLVRRACIVTITNNEIISATDTGNKRYTITISLSDVRFTTYEMPTGTDDLYAVKVEGEVFYDSSDGRAMRITVQNSQAGTVYTA